MKPILLLGLLLGGLALPACLNDPSSEPPPFDLQAARVSFPVDGMT